MTGVVKETGGNAVSDITILVADDDHSLLRLVTKVLSREGFKVDGVSTGGEILSRASSSGDLLLLMDYNLPDMSGRQVIEELGSRGQAKPFIVMTGHGDERLAVDMMKLGARDYVMKDVAFVDLLPSVVRQAVEQMAVEKKLRDAEAELSKSEEKFAKAFRASPDWVLILTVDGGRIVEANDTFLESTGYVRGEAEGSSCRDLGLCENPSHWREMFDILLSGQPYRNREMTVRAKSGQPMTLLLSAEAIEFGGQQCAICMARDITERKLDHEKLKASLREKEHLLKEIHHRVKNNLQVITSIINLQCGNMGDEAVKAVFDDIGGRIKSLTLVHEMLYGAEDFAMVDFGAYAGALMNNLYRHLGVSRSQVTPVMRFDGIKLGMDYAVPCGLIVNELATNALKYAFPGDRKGSVTISMDMVEGGSGRAGRMIVEDDGVGLPKGVDCVNLNTLGLKLVRLLAERQLGGSVKCTSDQGTKYHIEFPMTESDV